MKNFRLFNTALALYFVSAISYSDELCFNPAPCTWPNYGITVGGELASVYMSGKTLWHKVFPPYYTAGTLYAGYQFLKWLGIEAGYTSTGTKTKQNAFDSNTVVLPVPITPFNFTTRMQLKTAYLDLNYFLPLSPICGCFDFIGSVGIGVLKPSIKIIAHPSNSQLPLLLESLQPRTQAITRAGLGLRMRITDHLGIRTMLRFQQTSLMRVNGDGFFDRLKRSGIISEKLFKDQMSASIGLYAEF